MRASAPETPIEPRHRRSAARRGTGRRWLPLGVAVAVAIVGAGVYSVDQVSVPEISEPSLLALIPPTPDVPPVVTAPAGGDGAPAVDPNAVPVVAAAPVAPPAPVAVAVEEPAPAPAPRRSTGGATGGLPWNSGVVVGKPDEVTSWEDYRGRSVDVVHAFTTRDSWENIESASWIMGYYADFPGELVISQPFWPEDSGGSLGECAGGAYDSNWANYGRALVDAGRTDAFTRLAWEFNGDWFEWESTDVEAWKSCFRNVVQAVRSTAPDARFDWNFNAHGSQSSDGDAWLSYPGDEFVDVIGIDAYDHYPASTTAEDFDKQCTDTHGLCTAIDYARGHGKGVGVTEWGVIKSGAGDNPVYIEKMFETFSNAADVMEYETYFNEQEFGNALHAPNQNPASSEAYLSLFGG